MEAGKKVANVKTTKDIEEDVRKRTTKKDDIHKFYRIVNILEQDKDMLGILGTFMDYGLDAIKILSASVVDGNGEGYDPKKRKLRNSDNIGI